MTVIDLFYVLLQGPFLRYEERMSTMLMLYDHHITQQKSLPKERKDYVLVHG